MITEETQQVKLYDEWIKISLHNLLNAIGLIFQECFFLTIKSLNSNKKCRDIYLQKRPLLAQS